MAGLEDAGSSKKSYKPLFPSTYTMQCRLRQHTHVHTHVDFCLWGGISHTQHNCIIHRVCYTLAPTADWPQALCISGVSFISSRAFPRDESSRAPVPPQHPPCQRARRHDGCSQGKGIHAHGLLPSGRPQSGFGWWKTFLQHNHPAWPWRSCKQRCPIRESLVSSSSHVVLGAFLFKIIFVVRMHIKALSKNCHLTVASLQHLTGPQAG